MSTVYTQGHLRLERKGPLRCNTPFRPSLEAVRGKDGTSSLQTSTVRLTHLQLRRGRHTLENPEPVHLDVGPRAREDSLSNYVGSSPPTFHGSRDAVRPDSSLSSSSVSLTSFGSVWFLGRPRRRGGSRPLCKDFGSRVVPEGFLHLER